LTILLTGKEFPVTIQLGAAVKIVDPTVTFIYILRNCSQVSNYSAFRYLFRQSFISATNYEFILSIICQSALLLTLFFFQEQCILERLRKVPSRRPDLELAAPVVGSGGVRQSEVENQAV
jgi:hypothetical protein